MARDENLRPLLVVLAVMLATAGIALVVKHRVNSDEPDDPVTAAVARFEQFTEDMCRCTDATCAQQVSEQMTTWVKAMSEQQQMKDARPEGALKERMTKLTQRMSTCMQKAMVAPEAR